MKLGSNMFLDFAKGINFKNLSKPIDTDREPFNWHNISEFKYEKGYFGFKFREDLDEPFRKCYYGPAQRRGQPEKPIFGELPQRFPDGVPLPVPKINDLKELMQYIPPIHHDFFNNLPVGSDDEDEFEELQ